MTRTSRNLALVTLLITMTSVIGHTAVPQIGNSGGLVRVKGTAYVAVRDYIDSNGDEQCEVTVQLKYDNKKGSSEFEILFPGEGMDFHDHENAPFTTLDVVEMIVEEDLDSEVKVIREVLNVKKGKSRKAVPSGDRNAILVIVNYSDRNSPCDAACALSNTYTGTNYNVRDMYLESSYGDLNLVNTGVVTITLNYPYTDDAYPASKSLFQLHDIYKAACAQQLGIANVETGNDLVQYHTPALGNGIGVAYLNYFLGFVNSVAPDTIAHEMGHNFGFQHSGRDVDDDLTISSDSFQIYGDYSCTMGYQIGSSGVLRGFNYLTRVYAGWLSLSNAVTQSASSCSTYTILGLNNDQNLAIGPHAVRMDRGDGNFYYVTFRSNQGYDNYQINGYRNRVYVHNTAGSPTRKGFIAALASGGSWAAGGTTAEVTVLSIGSTTAQVEVCGFAAVDPSITASSSVPPSISASPSVPPSISASTSVAASPSVPPSISASTSVAASPSVPPSISASTSVAASPSVPPSISASSSVPPSASATMPPAPTPSPSPAVCIIDPASGSNMDVNRCYNECVPFPRTSRCWRCTCNVWDDWFPTVGLDCVSTNENRYSTKRCQVNCNIPPEFGVRCSNRCSCTPTSA